MKKTIFFTAISVLVGCLQPMISRAQGNAPVRIAVAGTTHGHVSWILGRKNMGDIELVGVYEKNQGLARQQQQQFRLDAGIFYAQLEEMLDKKKPEAVVAFGSIYEHMAVVEACAPRGIHVMVEKPLAVSEAHALRMDTLAKKYNIILLTNYETSWYPVTSRAYTMFADGSFAGKIRKAVFHHGHEGPKEIGVGKEFLQWLTDPVQNGGGALVDFGCYGANIMSWLMKGTAPIAVTAVTRQYKPAIYPRVDDEATIIVDYPEAQAVIQASWNWPFGRKDMEVYGETGYIVTSDANNMRWKNKGSDKEITGSFSASETGTYTDPFKYFADVIRKKITVDENSLYSLSNNLQVVKILEAARVSAASGKKVLLKN